MSIVARINKEEIDDKMLDSAVRRYIVQMEEDENDEFEMTDANIKYVKAEVLNQLIERQLLIQKARIVKIKVSEQEVNSRINAMKAEFDDLEDWENNLLAVGATSESIFDDVYEDILLEKYLDQVVGDELVFNDEDLQNYFTEYEDRMKEPDLYSFYEVYVHNSDEVNEVAFMLNSDKNVSDLKKDFKARSFQFEQYTDIPAPRLPEEIYNVLSDLEVGKIGTMLAGETQLIVYQLKKKQVGKKFVFKEIKGKLHNYLVSQGRKEILSRVVNQTLEEADIEYLDISSLESEKLHKK